uniref:Secreted protein n=1 Tax=Ascaris lumbricoides TaxID=6252 RepID=A0A0M3IRH9_ASCLU
MQRWCAIQFIQLCYNQFRVFFFPFAIRITYDAHTDCLHSIHVKNESAGTCYIVLTAA